MTFIDHSKRYVTNSCDKQDINHCDTYYKYISTCGSFDTTTTESSVLYCLFIICGILSLITDLFATPFNFLKV